MSETSSDWSPCETDSHQDHVIAHVIGARILGYFVFDEALHLILDMGFLWTVYLDGQMALLPTGVALAELGMSEDWKDRLRDEIDGPSEHSDHYSALTRFADPVSIKTVELFERNDLRRIVVEGEDSAVQIESSLSERSFTFPID